MTSREVEVEVEVDERQKSSYLCIDRGKGKLQVRHRYATGMCTINERLNGLQRARPEGGLAYDVARTKNGRPPQAYILIYN
jgi:hypothetical protein